MADALSGKGRVGKWVAIAAASGAVPPTQRVHRHD